MTDFDMITIEHLEVHFDVAGDGDEKVFADYFSRYIRHWERAYQQERQQQQLRRDQMLGDDQQGGSDVC